MPIDSSSPSIPHPTPAKRIVVVGAGGRLGSSLADFLETSHQVTRFDRKQLDLTSDASIEDALGGLDYDLLFLTGALTAVDYCETHEDEAYAANAMGPGKIAEISASKGAHVTYISTDMVFGGSKEGLYQETDIPDPISVYGASKLEGENRVLAASPDHLVARVSWVYGPGRPAFPEWIIDRACAVADLTLPGDKLCCPTHTIDLIGWLDALVFNDTRPPASGIYQLCNSNACTWRDWGQFCIDTAREAGYPVLAREITGVPVESVPAFVAKRPKNSAMSTEKFTQLTGIRPRDWKEALRDFVILNPSFNKYKPEAQQP